MSKKSKKYEVTSTGTEVVTVFATDSRDARRKAAAQIRKNTGMDYKDSAMTARCLEGQPASAPASKPKEKEKGVPPSATVAAVPTISQVVGWVLYYVNKGVEWLNANPK